MRVRGPVVLKRSHMQNLTAHAETCTGGRKGAQEGTGGSEGAYTCAENQCTGMHKRHEVSPSGARFVPLAYRGRHAGSGGGESAEGSGGCARACAENRCASVHKTYKTRLVEPCFVPLVHRGKARWRATEAEVAPRHASCCVVTA
jgi:hypothetical protein